MIEIKFNGKVFKIQEGTTLQEFLASEGLLNNASKIAIEVDFEVVSKSTYNEITLQNGMQIEAITFVGGG